MNTEIKEQAKNRLEEYLSFKGINTRKPFNCLNPEHADSTPSMSVDPHNKQYCKCFACGARYDIFDVIAAEYNIPPQSAQAFKKTYEVLGINTPSESRKEGKNTMQQEIQQITPTQEQNAVEVNTADYTAYYKNCMQNLENSKAAAEYLNSRGISVETALKCGVGFDEQADPAQSNHPTARIIVPTSKSHYVGRAISKTIDKAYQKMNNKGGKPDIFNRHIIGNSDIIFIVEGAMDALSLIEVNTAAIALNSTSNVKILLDILKEQGKPDTTYILSLDNDKAGRTATEELEKGLQALNIDYTIADVCGGYKDPNEHLTADKEHFILSVSEAEKKAAAGAKPDNVIDYINGAFFEDIEKFKTANNRKTGFKCLDEKAGGLYSGLYVVAAISSLGKTTFCHQIADQLAEQGEDVLFFSLEQSRLELITKSFARTTARLDITNAVTSLQIRRGGLTSSQYKTLEIAVETYKKQIGDRLSVIEGNFDSNITFISDYIRRYIRKTNTRPIVFVDYLQILQPPQSAQGIRESIDTTVTELKRLSREYNITIFVISSVNRSNYLTPIDFESLKESGGIEYTADVVYGLQLQALSEELFTTDKKIKDKRERIREAKKENPRQIELVCLKNRYGVSSFNCYFEYNPKYDLYSESKVQPEQAAEQEVKQQKKRIKL